MKQVTLKAPILDITEVAEYLRQTFIVERREEFHPLSPTKIKKPGRAMRLFLEDLGADFIKPPNLEETAYVMDLVTDTGKDFATAEIIIDFWTDEVWIIYK